MRLLLALMVALPLPVLAQTEDETHRADRTQTEDLNRSVQRSVEQRNAADAAKLSRYRDATIDYERRRAEWRRRVAACEGGDDSACIPN